jgi:rubredoxin|tara:strand:+ start:1848 stop:2021 length:174 start_codon:yes stop_codon:yes gene_type:complete
MKKYECPDCGYIYDEAVGVEHEGYPAGTKFNDLPEDFPCPECFVREKPDFVEVEKEI